MCDKFRCGHHDDLNRNNTNINIEIVLFQTNSIDLCFINTPSSTIS